MGFRVQIWSGGALWNPLSFLIKDSIQSNLWTGKESSLLKIQLVKNNITFFVPQDYIHKLYFCTCDYRFLSMKFSMQNNRKNQY